MNTTVQCLAARIHGDRAASFFDRPRLGNLYGVLGGQTRVAKRGDPESRKPPFVECLWMPAYAVLVQATVGGSESSVWTSVDGWSGEVALIDGPLDPTPCQKTDDFFAPDIDETRAAQLALGGLQRFTVRRRGQTRKPIIVGIRLIALYYYPVWTWYFRRWKSADIKVLDGITGKPAGAKVRMSVLNALVAARRGAGCTLST